jgi:hypothetical protein
VSVRVMGRILAASGSHVERLKRPAWRER